MRRDLASRRVWRLCSRCRSSRHSDGRKSASKTSSCFSLDDLAVRLAHLMNELFTVDNEHLDESRQSSTWLLEAPTRVACRLSIGAYTKPWSRSASHGDVYASPGILSVTPTENLNFEVGLRRYEERRRSLLMGQFPSRKKRQPRIGSSIRFAEQLLPNRRSWRNANYTPGGQVSRG